LPDPPNDVASLLARAGSETIAFSARPGSPPARQTRRVRRSRAPRQPRPGPCLRSWRGRRSAL